MEVTGRVKMIDTTKEVGSAGFKKRDIVVTTDEQYPQQILVQFVQDKCDLLNNYVVGDNVKIDINLRGREWTNAQGETVYFNTIQGWRIGKVQTENPAAHWESDLLDLKFQTDANQLAAAVERIEITFYPQGGSTGGLLNFGLNERSATIKVDPITGRITTAYNGETLAEEK
jgi:hypothetical protein